ncbi:uncharacterized protein LOC115258411 [Aedes albopictus]|uniref:SWIM-type domain-containing protein n=1 Tax=Aedes albopictus TaxID=7160 RepID=A0ABM1ZHS0_AEDAL
MMIAADNLCSVGTRLSEYARKLPQNNPNVRKRYIEKIKIIKFNDPYTLQLSSDMPTTVTTGHVVDYLINFKSPYTGESVKNLRSLDAYRKFEAGFVQSMKGRLMENFYIVVGKVAHLMRLNEKPLNPWVIVQKEGMIISAHCDCAAGISETCSHVSAILYALANLHQLTTDGKITVTDVPAYWKQPRKRVKDDLYKMVKDVGYGKKIKRYYDTNINKSHTDFLNLLEMIKQDGNNAAVFGSHCDGVNFTCTQCCENNYPDEIFLNKSILLQNNFNPNLVGRSLDELISIGKTIPLELTSNETSLVENLTRKQHKSNLWHWARTGRITASVLREVVYSSNRFPPPKRSLLKRICHPYKEKAINTPAVTYGKQNEAVAIRDLEHILKQTHQDVKLVDSGIVIDPKYPFMAASPDCMMQCSCCGSAPVEIKCPYRLSENSPLNLQLSLYELSKSKDSFIEFDGDRFTMVKTHKYYYQVQAQIFMTQSNYGIFMVWSRQEKLVIYVAKDEVSWTNWFARSKLYFQNIVIPELLGHYFTYNTN